MFGKRVLLASTIAFFAFGCEDSTTNAGSGGEGTSSSSFSESASGLSSAVVPVSCAEAFSSSSGTGGDGSSEAQASSSSAKAVPLSSSVSVSSSSLAVLPSSSSAVQSSSSSVAASSSANVSAWCNTTGNCGTFTDSRDSHVYKWVAIGTQTWMAENLAYLPSVNGVSDHSHSVVMYYVHNYDGHDVAEAKASSNYTTYGVLYNWPAAMAGAAASSANPSSVQGICPTGWHMPSDAEWAMLETYVGGNSTAGTKLKSASGWAAEGDKETDVYGFSALPGDYYCGSGCDNDLREGHWWSTSEYDVDATYAYDWYLIAYVGRASMIKSEKNRGFSVRCVKNSV